MRKHSKLVPPNYTKQDKLRYWRKYYRYLEKSMKTVDKYIKELERTVYKSS